MSGERHCGRRLRFVERPRRRLSGLENSREWSALGRSLVA